MSQHYYYRHLEKCKTSFKKSTLDTVLMSLDGQEYYCQMGCDGCFTFPQIVQHLAHNHTKEQLYQWRIILECLLVKVGMKS